MATGEPSRGGRLAKPDGLVRPYVLNAGNRAHRRPAHGGACERLTRGDQPALDWTDGLDSRRDGPTMPRATTPPLPEVKPAGSHRSLPRRPTPTERRWLVASGAGVAALAIVGSLIMFLSQPPKLLASACGAGACASAGPSVASSSDAFDCPALPHASQNQSDVRAAECIAGPAAN
jgi:hypothetical protein